MLNQICIVFDFTCRSSKCQRIISSVFEQNNKDEQEIVMKTYFPHYAEENIKKLKHYIIETLKEGNKKMNFERILLYGFARNNYELIRAAMEELNCAPENYDFSTNRKEAFEQCRRLVPQLVFAVWKGDEETISFLRNIREDIRSPNRSLPTIVLSPLKKVTEVFKACEAKVTDYIILPINKDDLKIRLSETFQRNGLAAMTENTSNQDWAVTTQNMSWKDKPEI